MRCSRFGRETWNFFGILLKMAVNEERRHECLDHNQKVNLGWTLINIQRSVCGTKNIKKDRREEGIDRERLVKESRKELAPQS